MELYLVQHGEARPESEDPERSLTGKGRESVKRVAAWAARAGVKVDEIRHSGKLRSQQTAGIFADHLSPPGGVRSVSGLGPKDDIRPLAESLRQSTGALMLVGHLPFLSRLLSFMIVQDPDRVLVQFRMGGMVCLTRDEGQWCLAWAVTPDLIDSSQ